jgi:hypothetical protein
MNSYEKATIEGGLPVRRVFNTLVLSAVIVTLLTGTASAITIIDFATGNGGPGGTVNIGANVTGSNILIDTVTILGAPVNNGVFDVDGAGVCADPVGGCGLLGFDKNLNTITIVGSIPALGILAPITLLIGDLSGGVNVVMNSPVTGSITAAGNDLKASALLTAIGLAPNTPFTHFGFVTGVNGAGTGSPYTALSTDITNAQAVPEPSSITLLGIALTGVGFLVRRRFVAPKH